MCSRIISPGAAIVEDSIQFIFDDSARLISNKIRAFREHAAVNYRTRDVDVNYALLFTGDEREREKKERFCSAGLISKTREDAFSVPADPFRTRARISASTRVDALETLTAFNRRRCAFTTVHRALRVTREEHANSAHAYVYIYIHPRHPESHGCGFYDGRNRNIESTTRERPSNIIFPKKLKKGTKCTYVPIRKKTVALKKAIVLISLILLKITGIA